MRKTILALTLLLGSSLPALADSYSPTLGGGFTIKTGTATLSSGSATVADTAVTSNTVVIVTQKTGTPAGEEFSYTVSAGASISIKSTNAASTAVVGYVEYIK